VPQKEASCSRLKRVDKEGIRVLRNLFKEDLAT
jgi:hypothetical protein